MIGMIGDMGIMRRNARPSSADAMRPTPSRGKAADAMRNDPATVCDPMPGGAA